MAEVGRGIISPDRREACDETEGAEVLRSDSISDEIGEYISLPQVCRVMGVTYLYRSRSFRYFSLSFWTQDECSTSPSLCDILEQSY